MILTPAIAGRQRPVGGPSIPVYYDRAGYDDFGPAGVLVTDQEPVRQMKMAFPNGNGPTTYAPGSAIVPQINS